MLHLLFIAVRVPHFFSRLFHQLSGHREVLHALGPRRHAVEHAQPVGFIGDRYISDFVLKAGAGGMKQIHPLFRQAFTTHLCWVVLLHLLAGDLHAIIFQDGLNHD